MLENEEAAAIRSMTAATAKYLGEFGKGTFKDGIKSVTKSRIHELIKSGKAPIDAFFEGKKVAALDGAKKAADGLEAHRVEVQEKPAPVLAARAVATAMNAHYDEVDGVQKDQTQRAWLRYQAQSRLGTRKTGRTDASGAEEVLTPLGHIPGEVGGITPTVEGVVFVDLYPGERYSHELVGGALPGLTRAMLTRIQDVPLSKLGLPIVYRIMADKNGRGIRLPPGSSTGEENQFSIRVDEAGNVYNMARYPWHRQLLARWVSGDPSSPAEWERGAHSIAYLGYVLTLRQLGVGPDKE